MVVVQSVLLFGSESWVVTPLILRDLGSFHNREERRILGWMPQCQNSYWEYLPIGEALVEAGLDFIGEYISCHHISVAQYIATR